MKFIDQNVDLSWEPGLGAITQTVYFGDDYDTITNATTGSIDVGGGTTYDPGLLELEKIYYWRVDTDGIFGLVHGDVWSFTTAGAGGGVRADYYHHDGETSHNPAELAFGNLVLTRIDPQINFNWAEGSPDPSININDFSCKWTGEVKTAFTEIYTFYTNTDDGVRLWVDGHLIIDNWTDHTTTEDSGRIYLIGGKTYPLEMWWYERDSNAVAELRWSSPHTPKQLIPQAALSPPGKASDPIPCDGALLVNFPGLLAITLSWKPGYFAVSHDVYFGTNYAEVEAGTGETFRGNQDDKYFLVGYGYTPNDPCPTGFVPGTTYFWRIDEVEADGITKYTGDIWSFSLPPTKAYTPIPSDGCKFVDPNVDLKWKRAMGAIVQTVYFGNDYDIVTNATTGGIEVGYATTYDPGMLELETVYYWRVDTAGVFGRFSGDVWSFSTANFIVVDDFEDYKDVEPERIFDTWIDGRSNSKNGSLVGCMQYPDFVHGGKRSMLFNYDNSYANYSQASADIANLKAGQDWIEPGTKALTLWFHGHPDNAPEPIYVAVADDTSRAIVYHDNPNAAQIDIWTEWNIELKDFTGVNLTDVNSIAIGFGDRKNPQLGGSGEMYFDDISLYRSRCVPAMVTLSEADLNGDCVVDFRDLEIMAGDWLKSGPDISTDLNVDNRVDFNDYAVLADEWLDKQLWPE
jgi:hypothetical protein